MWLMVCCCLSLQNEFREYYHHANDVRVCLNRFEGKHRDSERRALGLNNAYVFLKQFFDKQKYPHPENVASRMFSLSLDPQSALIGFQTKHSLNRWTSLNPKSLQLQYKTHKLAAQSYLRMFAGSLLSLQNLQYL